LFDGEFCRADSIDPLCKAIIHEVHGTQVWANALQPEVRLSVLGDAQQGFFDEKLMGHIFGNLLTNAVKYSPDGASVDFRVDCGADAFVFTVTDYGIGIPEADLPGLFESFNRASNVGNIPGTGLGLAIVKRSVELHSGTISVTSVLGKGTVCVVTLPRSFCRPGS
jgi:signal transduction histidine kinase